MSYEQKRWENIHRNLTYAKELPNLCSFFWKRCYLKIDRN